MNNGQGNEGNETRIDRPDVDGVGPPVSIDSSSTHGRALSISTDLFCVRLGRAATVWRSPRLLEDAAANTPLQSLGRMRIRPPVSPRGHTPGLTPGLTPGCGPGGRRCGTAISSTERVIGV
jgi:hypothetical protein